MPTQWSTTSFLYGQGISQKHEEKAVPLGKLETLENASFDDWGSLHKRFGYTSLSTTLTTGMNTFDMMNSYQLIPYKESVIAMCIRDFNTGDADTPEGQYVGPKAFTYISSLGKWQDSGNYYGTSIQVDRVGPDILNVSHSDIAVTDNYYAQMIQYTTDPSIALSGGIFSIVDKTTKKRLVDWSQFFTSGQRSDAKLAGFSDRVWMLASATGVNNNLYYYEWLEDAPHTPVVEQTLITDIHATSRWDAIVMNDELHICYQLTDNATIQYKVFDADANLVSSFTTTALISNRITLGEAFTSGQIAVAWEDNATTQIRVFKTAGASILDGPWSVFDTTGLPILGLAVTGNEWTTIWVGYSATSGRSVVNVDINSSGTKRSFTGLSVISNASICSRGFSVFEGKSGTEGEVRMVWVGNHNDEQGGFYLMSTPVEWNDNTTPASGATHKQIVHAKCFYQSGDIPLDDNRSGIIVDEDGYTTSLLSKSILLSDGFVRSFFNRVKVETKQKNVFVEAADTTLISGGVLHSIRGGTPTEECLFEYPENIGLTTSTTGGLLTAGIYGVIAIYEWRDKEGIMHRSAPSTPQLITTTTAVSTIDFDGEEPNKDKYSPNMGITVPQLVFYRTEVNGSIYYRDWESLGGAGSSTQADSTLIDNELLYTTGGVLGNYSPPPSKFVWTNKDRVFLLASDEDYIWYSKPSVQGLSWEFNPVLKIQLDKKAVAGSNMDGRQVIFYSNAIGHFSGDGPNALGVGAFSKIEILPTSIGCRDKFSIAQIDTGILFKSETDFYLLDRSLQLSPIGVDVSEYNDQTVLSNVVNDRKVFFAMSGGDILVYDWLVQQWNVHKIVFNSDDTSSLIDICLLEDTIYTVSNDSTNQMFVQKESTTGHTDSDNSVSLKAVTGWIQLSNTKQDWVRVRRISILGEKKTDHTLTVKIYQDYNDTTPTQTETIDASTITTEPYLLRIRLDNQKCSAIKVEISDTVVAETSEGFSITELALEIGVKRGINKTESGKTF